jgi:hypothetical protein
MKSNSKLSTQNSKLLDLLWLGYDGLELPFSEIAAVLIYRPAFDDHIVRAYGSVPMGVRAVIVTAEGNYLPARWAAVQLRVRWARWRSRQGYTNDDDPDRGFNSDDSDAR